MACLCQAAVVLLLHQMMKMIENRNIASMGFQSPQAVQLMIEAERGLMQTGQNTWAMLIFIKSGEKAHQ